MGITSLELLTGCALGALLGVFGQGLRAVAGLKKQSEEAAAQGKSLSDTFDGTSFGVSLFIGGVAGVAGYLGLRFGAGNDINLLEGTTVLGVIAAGYAGADFIEAFAKRWLPKGSVGTSATSRAAPSTSTP